MIMLALVAAAFSFLISAWAGLGGSLILVPVLSLLLGPKEGIAAASLLLAGNNLAKVAVYWRTIPLRIVATTMVLTVLGTAIGARLLLAAPDAWISTSIVVIFAATFFAERVRVPGMKRTAAPILAFGAGATSGFSGTSGPLKGIALRTLALDRMHFVGAASAVSFAGDVTKTAIFADAALLNETSWLLVLAALLIMPLAALAGRQLNTRLGAQVHNVVFWLVMGGYTLRLLFA
jgi:hypothetical protein